MRENKWLVVTGDINEGFTFYGPFDDARDADRWAKKQRFYPNYVLAELQHPGDQ